MKSGAVLTAILPIAALLTACSGSSVDATCDVEGVTDEVGHMVQESSMTMDSLDDLQCSGDWAFARTTVSGGADGSTSATFLFERTEAGWILKAPELVCGNDAEVATIPADLVDAACASG